MLAAICKSCWALRHDVEGKIVPGGNDASKEKGKKEETLRQNARPSLAAKKNWHGLSKNISREVFYFGPRNSCSPRSIMLETQGTLISASGCGVCHDHPRQIETPLEERNRRPRQTVFPHRRSFSPVPPARLRSAILATRIPAPEA